MRLKHKGILLLLNALVGGGYVATILLLIHWVCNMGIGVGAVFVPIGILLVIVLGWMIVDRRKYGSQSVPRNIASHN